MGLYNLANSNASNNVTSACPYRIGDVLITTNSELPDVTWPGTFWKKLGSSERIALVATTDSNLVNRNDQSSIGSNSVELAESNLPQHSHSMEHRHDIPNHNHIFTGTGGYTGYETANHNHSTTTYIDPSSTSSLWFVTNTTTSGYGMLYGSTGTRYTSALSSNYVTGTQSANHQHSFTPAGTIGDKTNFATDNVTINTGTTGANVPVSVVQPSKYVFMYIRIEG